MKLFWLIVAGFIAIIAGLHFYNESGMRTAQRLCTRDGILRVHDAALWRAVLTTPPSARRDLRMLAGPLDADPRFTHSLYRLRVGGRVTADLDILRFVAVSLVPAEHGPDFLCAWDVRRAQFEALSPRFF